MPIKKIRKVSFESYEIAKALERTSANEQEEDEMRLAIELSNMPIKKIRKKVSFESYDIAKARERTIANEEEQMRLAIELSNTHKTEDDELAEAIRVSCVNIDDYWTSKTSIPEDALHRSRYEASWKNTDCSCNRCCWLRMCWITDAEQPKSFEKIAIYNNDNNKYCTTRINQWKTDVILNLVKV